MEIKNCVLADVDKILALYNAAMQLQMEKKSVVWPKFEKSFIEKEIREERQWKLIVDNEIACNWAITFEDKEIWEEKYNDYSIFIHRIATNPAFRGNRFVDSMVTWAKEYTLSIGKKYIRLDTIGYNTKLIEIYTSAGFSFLGSFKLKNIQNLPAHYREDPNCLLFEIVLK